MSYTTSLLSKYCHNLLNSAEDKLWDYRAWKNYSPGFDSACSLLLVNGYDFIIATDAVWLCGCVAVWLRGCVAVWLCGCVAVWLCGCVAAWLCGCVAVWLCGCVAVCMCRTEMPHM